MSRRQPELLILALGAVSFAFALGAAGVAVPLLAVLAGYGIGEIGIFIAISALAQMATRLKMGTMMQHFSYKTFVVGSGVIMAVSCVWLAVSSEWYVFAASQLLQGIARAFFWTGSQTHGVRAAAVAVVALARINLAGGIGLVSGPAVAGILIEQSNTQVALTTAGLIGLLTALPAALLLKLPVFTQAPSTSSPPVRIDKRPGVNSACWAGASAGGWRGMLSSFVPVAPDHAGQAPSTVGILVAFASGAALLGGAGAGWVRAAGLRPSLVFGVLSAGLGIAAVGPTAPYIIGAAISLVLSGLGAGILETVGPAVAVQSVHAEERGAAIAIAGTFRSGAMFTAPLGVSAMVTLIPLSSAILLVGFVITLPSFTIRKLKKSSCPN